MSYFYVEYLLSHSTEKFHEGTLQAVVLKNSGFEKVRKKGGLREYQDFPTKMFFSRCRKFW